MATSEEKFFESLAKGGPDNHHYKVDAGEDSSETEEKTPAKKWADDEIETEGKLTIDVYKTPSEIVVESAIAGIKPEDLDVNVSTDSITIKGERRRDEKIKDGDYFYQECYWGRFSRSVILPEEIDPDRATVNFKNGILTVRLPKLNRKKSKKLNVKIE
ncbi:MAG: Hsp20/alpha crystallin family protein [Candidatus Liptonbacteria bacterium]|nr:Hsp20/alpha crystallin family protein [Candidatus Liptonbacteria bacterium]